MACSRVWLAVFEAGNVADSVYVVLAGSVSIHMRIPGYGGEVPEPTAGLSDDSERDR